MVSVTAIYTQNLTYRKMLVMHMTEQVDRHLDSQLQRNPQTVVPIDGWFTQASYYYTARQWHKNPSFFYVIKTYISFYIT